MEKIKPQKTKLKNSTVEFDALKNYRPFFYLNNMYKRFATQKHILNFI